MFFGRRRITRSSHVVIRFSRFPALILHLSRNDKLRRGLRYWRHIKSYYCIVTRAPCWNISPIFSSQIFQKKLHPQHQSHAEKCLSWSSLQLLEYRAWKRLGIWLQQRAPHSMNRRQITQTSLPPVCDYRAIGKTKLWRHMIYRCRGFWYSFRKLKNWLNSFWWVVMAKQPLYIPEELPWGKQHKTVTPCLLVKVPFFRSRAV